MNLLKKNKLRKKKIHRTLKQKFADDLEISIKNYENKDNNKNVNNLDNTKFVLLGFVFLIIVILISFLFIF